MALKVHMTGDYQICPCLATAEHHIHMLSRYNAKCYKGVTGYVFLMLCVRQLK